MIDTEHSETVRIVKLRKVSLFLMQPKISLFLLPIATFSLWLLSLRGIDFRQMNDLGLVSVFSTITILALITMIISFCVSLQRTPLRTSILLLHVFLLIFMLYGVTTLVEEAPRFSVLYRHAGYTEYIMRTGTVAPNLDAYFNWPGFFILSAFVTRIISYHDIFSFAVWAPVFLNLVCLGPLYSILSTATSNKRLIWLALCFFYLTNWIGQDYYSPQGLNFYLYLVIIAILLRWFKRSSNEEHKQVDHFLRYMPLLMRKLYNWLAVSEVEDEPVEPRLRSALLPLLLIIFALVVSSHPLTPYFVLTTVPPLLIFLLCT